MLQLSYINLHFDFKNSLQCIYLIINVIFTLLENIFMNFKVFLLIFDISIFIKKYPPIYLRYIRYIHKMQVPIYPLKQIFSTLIVIKGVCVCVCVCGVGWGVVVGRVGLLCTMLSCLSEALHVYVQASWLKIGIQPPYDSFSWV